jgi:threonine dehydratase
VSQLALKHPSYHISSAYDCHFVIEGNASLGREIAQAHPDADAVLAPIGGGGLSAGICLGLKAMGSEIELWGAEPAMADDAIRSLKAGRLLRNDIEPQTMADGARTVSLGQRNWEILKSGIHSIVPVSEQFIANGLRLFHSVGLRVEPTGALTLAALLQNPNRSKGKTIVAVISGGNVDEQIYQQILLERNNSYK